MPLSREATVNSHLWDKEVLPLCFSLVLLSAEALYEEPSLGLQGLLRSSG